MQIKITINLACNNAAFAPDDARGSSVAAYEEVMRIINDGTMPWVIETALETATDTVTSHIGRILKDVNGNTVGRIDAEVQSARMHHAAEIPAPCRNDSTPTTKTAISGWTDSDLTIVLEAAYQALSDSRTGASIAERMDISDDELDATILRLRAVLWID